eukprot:691922-Prorocentrum_minimum.AAC.2
MGRLVFRTAYDFPHCSYRVHFAIISRMEAHGRPLSYLHPTGPPPGPLWTPSEPLSSAGRRWGWLRYHRSPGGGACGQTFGRRGRWGFRRVTGATWAPLWTSPREKYVFFLSGFAWHGFGVCIFITLRSPKREENKMRFKSKNPKPCTQTPEKEKLTGGRPKIRNLGLTDQSTLLVI